MADFDWPEDLAPYKVTFYLQPHVGGTQSPLTRVRKVYGLSAPRWIARMTFRAGYDGAPDPGAAEGFGPRLDAIIATLEGGLVRARFHDWRRPYPVRPQMVRRAPFHLGAAAGASTVRVGGFEPGSIAFSVGDYVGGDGRPHIVNNIGLPADAIIADAGGVATLSIKPPLVATIAAGAPLVWPVTGVFRLTSEDAGENDTTVGEFTEYVLGFEEDLD